MTEAKVLPELLITTRGWEHPGWQDGFYPEDLPEDWHLGYFANSFPAVLISASELDGLEPTTVEGWLDELEDEFVFYLEADVSSELRTAFGDRLGGVLAESKISDVRTFATVSDVSLPNAPESTIFISSDDEECFCLYRPGVELTLADLRVDIEGILAVSVTAKRCILCWDTEEPLAGALENAKVIAELLGA